MMKMIFKLRRKILIVGRKITKNRASSTGQRKVVSVIKKEWVIKSCGHRTLNR